jgi:hypothetical protein
MVPGAFSGEGAVRGVEAKPRLPTGLKKAGVKFRRRLAANDAGFYFSLPVGDGIPARSGGRFGGASGCGNCIGLAVCPVCVRLFLFSRLFMTS